MVVSSFARFPQLSEWDFKIFCTVKPNWTELKNVLSVIFFFGASGGVLRISNIESSLAFETQFGRPICTLYQGRLRRRWPM